MSETGIFTKLDAIEFCWIDNDVDAVTEQFLVSAQVDIRTVWTAMKEAVARAVRAEAALREIEDRLGAADDFFTAAAIGPDERKH